MDTEDFVVDNGTETKVIKDLTAVAPYIRRAIFTDAFFVEAIDLGDLPALVVASNEGYSIRITYFQCQKKQESFNRVKSTIDEVAYTFHMSTHDLA